MSSTVVAASQADPSRISASRPKVSPHTYDLVPAFIVAIINDTSILRAQLSVGATMIASENAELKRPENVTANQQVRVMVYSPNLCGEDFPHYIWDAEILIDGKAYHVGSIEQRCEVHHLLLNVPGTSRRVQLRVHRIKQKIQKSRESELLCRQVVEMMQDQAFNPRTGSLPLPVVAKEAQARFPMAYRKVIGGEYFGSFRGFIIAHETMIAIFKYRDREVAKKHNSTIDEERVAIRKELRDSTPPMLVPGAKKEQVVINLIREALQEQDSHVHRLIRTLSVHDEFRIGMSAAFSSLMHWLQRHRDIFRWSTDPQQLCTIGLVPDATFDPENNVQTKSLRGTADKPKRDNFLQRTFPVFDDDDGTTGGQEGGASSTTAGGNLDDEAQEGGTVSIEDQMAVEAALDEAEEEEQENTRHHHDAIGDEGEEEYDDDLEEVVQHPTSSGGGGGGDAQEQQQQQEEEEEGETGEEIVG